MAQGFIQFTGTYYHHDGWGNHSAVDVYSYTDRSGNTFYNLSHSQAMAMQRDDVHCCSSKRHASPIDKDRTKYYLALHPKFEPESEGCTPSCLLEQLIHYHHANKPEKIRLYHCRSDKDRVMYAYKGAAIGKSSLLLHNYTIEVVE